jgi:hypothetical protein
MRKIWNALAGSLDYIGFRGSLHNYCTTFFVGNAVVALVYGRTLGAAFGWILASASRERVGEGISRSP